MKKIIITIMAVVMAMVLVSCGNEEPAQSNKYNDTDKRVVESMIIRSFENGEITVQEWHDAVEELYGG